MTEAEVAQFREAMGERSLPIPPELFDRPSIYRGSKRLFDLCFAACVIAILLLPSLVLCTAISLDSPGAPIYTQYRVGRITKNGKIKTFKMYKFRSMAKDADKHLAELQHLNEADGPLFKIKDDPRLTRIGKFIRKHSIDELPQFINVFLGQLSTVGPRPPLPEEVLKYEGRAIKRLAVKPGITGYWQITGRSNTTFDNMVRLDLKYIEDRSFLTDLKLIVRTIGVMFIGRGAY